uniref:zinc finger protein 512B isoform X2 n=1 Tax=Doryrhamphus excisus TaxID=161450 RepID=UPI0025AE7EA8|nr:zinc finger protein 512B isoform X2 [Doryrhamphus excisus]
MESPSGTRLGKLSISGLPRGQTSKHGHTQEPVRTVPCPENNNKHTPVFDEAAEGKRKGRPKAEEQELRSIPPHMMVQWKEEFKRRSRVKCPCSGCWLEFPSIYGVKYHYQRCQGTTVTEKQSHGCPYCEAAFATKVRLHKHKLWNHPNRVTLESKDEQLKLQKTAVKFSSVKRPLGNSPSSPMFFKVKKTLEVSTPSHNGELTHQRSERKQYSQPSLQSHHSQSVQPQFEHSQSTSSDAGGSESEGGSFPPTYADEDPERMKHRRKQKTPKKFTGEQPSISGTFGLKGMTKVEEKLKASRVKRPEGSSFSEDPHRRPTANQSSNKRTATTSSGTVSDVQWQKAISERGEVVCPTCSIVTRKTIHGLKKHLEICQKLQEALKCQQCHKQFRSKAGLNYHTMAEHNSKPSWREGQMEDEHEERERLRRILKQMGKIKCPSELNYTRPGLPSFSRELLETWKNQVKENGFICCTNENCDAVYSSVSGLKAHLANCSQGGGGLAKYTCLICQKEFNSESGVKYHISKTHSQNWFRATDSEGISSSMTKPLEDNGIKADVRNSATTGKKRGRKPKERSPVVVALETQTQPPTTTNEDSVPDMTPLSDSTQSPTQNSDFTDIVDPDLKRQPNASTARRSKLNRPPLSE